MEWKIRRLEARDEAAFVPFLGNWITEQPVAVHFDWLYRGNPHGNAITWIVVLGGEDRIVGCTSAFPRRMRLDGESILGCFGGDAFVDPDFRRRGIAQSLHEYCATDMRRLEIECLYGFPVPANFRAFERAGALGPCDFHRFWLPLNAERIVRSLHLGPFAPIAATILNPAVNLYLAKNLFRNSRPGIRLQVVGSFDSKVDELFDSVAHRFGICCVRDAAYLNWRFSNHPFINSTIVKWQDNGSLLAYAVLDLRTKQCQILDFLVRDDAEIGHDFLASLAQFASDKGKWSIELNLNASGPGVQLFRRSGFKRHGTGHRLMVHTIHDQEKDKIFSDPGKWFLMPGDRDVG